jgi:hypothetical protein
LSKAKWAVVDFVSLNPQNDEATQCVSESCDHLLQFFGNFKLVIKPKALCKLVGAERINIAIRYGI